MNRGIVITLVAAVLLIGGFFVYRNLTPSTPAPTSMTTTPVVTTPEAMPASSPTASTSAAMVSISNANFSPATITIKMGETVTWTNTDTITHNVSSDDHPTHKTYSPLNLGTIKAGESKSLSFPTAGSYMYHDHIYPKLTGTVVVQ